jgi:cytochrome c oxidase subunit 4
MSEHHVEKKSVYFGIFGALMVLTALTVWVAFQDFGILNNVLALGIAVLKATLVILYFMHVRHSNNLTKMVVVASVFWLLILLAFVVQDYLSRGLLPYPGK